ncbi:MAG: GHKL domain-containing protein, partial [Oscillospiraceae bacterium]|nr:GHKL domain-containing protein [Oscillospiraceae bacterium]
TTGVFPIDSLLQYMCCKAQAAGIQLKLTLLASMKYLTENIIPSSDLRTILADLIENAVIAIKSSNSSNKKILVSLGIINQFYEMDIYDSGIPFESETIRHLGQKNNTTHADAGGSGIGLVTVLEILERYNASFCIEQIQNTHNIFTKKISIKFDNFNERIFKTDNNELVHILPAAHYSNVNFENSKQRLIS